MSLQEDKIYTPGETVTLGKGDLIWVRFPSNLLKGTQCHVEIGGRLVAYVYPKRTPRVNYDRGFTSSGGNNLQWNRGEQTVTVPIRAEEPVAGTILVETVGSGE